MLATDVMLTALESGNEDVTLRDVLDGVAETIAAAKWRAKLEVMDTKTLGVEETR